MEKSPVEASQGVQGHSKVSFAVDGWWWKSDVRGLVDSRCAVPAVLPQPAWTTARSRLAGSWQACWRRMTTDDLMPGGHVDSTGRCAGNLSTGIRCRDGMGWVMGSSISNEWISVGVDAGHWRVPEVV